MQWALCSKGEMAQKRTPSSSSSFDHSFWLQLIAINNQVERNSGESRMKLTHLEGDTNTQMSMIDAKTRQLVDEVKTSMATMHTAIDSDRDRMEQRLMSMIEKNGASKDLLIVSTV